MNHDIELDVDTADISRDLEHQAAIDSDVDVDMAPPCNVRVTPCNPDD